MQEKMLHTEASSPADMHDVASRLAQHLEDGDVVTLVGGLGAGKTQFAQGVGEGLGVDEPMTSPTFNIVFEYESGRIPLRHFDLYRLQDALQLEDVDFHALTDPSTPGASLVEWADMFEEEMPDDVLAVRISEAPGDGHSRSIDATATGPRSERLLSKWRKGLGLA